MKAFIGLVCGLLIPMFLVGVGLRYKGLAQRYQVLDHPMSQKNFLLIAYQGGSATRPANTWQAIDRVRKMSKNILIWLDIQQTKDGKIVLFADDRLESQTDAKGYIGFSLWTKVRKLDAAFRFKQNGTFPFRGKGYRIQTLSDTLQRYPKAEFVLNIRANTKKIDIEVAQLLEDNRAENRTIIVSPFEIVTKSIRKKKPLGMYGIGFAEYTRLNMFTSIHVGPAVPVHGDIFITPRIRYLKTLSSELIEELHRRKKKVIGWATTDKELQQWRQKKIDGVLTNRPALFLDTLKN